jgi:hypothetical protein
MRQVEAVIDRVVEHVNAQVAEHNRTCVRACDIVQSIQRSSWRLLATRVIRNRVRVRLGDDRIEFEAEGWFDDEHGLIRCRVQTLDGVWEHI